MVLFITRSALDDAVGRHITHWCPHDGKSGEALPKSELSRIDADLHCAHWVAHFLDWQGGGEGRCGSSGTRVTRSVTSFVDASPPLEHIDPAGTVGGAWWWDGCLIYVAKASHVSRSGERVRLVPGRRHLGIHHRGFIWHYENGDSDNSDGESHEDKVARVDLWDRTSNQNFSARYGSDCQVFVGRFPSDIQVCVTDMRWEGLPGGFAW